MGKKQTSIAIWVVTPGGVEVAHRIGAQLDAAELYLSENLDPVDVAAHRFSRLKTAVEANFWDYQAHIFIMATGIVVRTIAPLILHKTKDPAVLSIDDQGRYVISLLSGHIGGANELTDEIAGLIDALPVITTATDIHGKPAIDVIARKKGLHIENPEAIKYVNMAFITDSPVRLHDPRGIVKDELEGVSYNTGASDPPQPDTAGVFVDDAICDVPPKTLVLRPGTLTAGIGCNRNTPCAEIRALLLQTLAHHNLAPESLTTLASIDVKSDEEGLLELAREMELPLRFFNREELNQVKTIQNPSAMVEKHVGVKSVCEAAAILASHQGHLIVSKQKTQNVTVAIARINSPL
jgi:cobalt-precorrin 5A hydrolase